MRFDVITIFPELFESFLGTSLMRQGREKELLDVRLQQLRDWTDDAHNTVDDSPFGGGRGMVMKIEPIFKAVSDLKKTQVADQTSKVVLFSPRGKQFTQAMADRWAQLDQLILICGRYEGVDERVAQYIADEEVSIGDYVLMGGELPAMVTMEAVARLVPGVLGKSDQLAEERFTQAEPGEGRGFIEYPQYTRPAVFNPAEADPDSPLLDGGDGSSWGVPDVLLSGDHKRIEKWRRDHSATIA